MSVLETALAELSRKIYLINGETPSSLDVPGIIGESNEIDFTHEVGNSSPSVQVNSSHDYAANVVIAVKHIVKITQESLSLTGMLALFGKKGEQLSDNFDYLDSNTWVPKIIDAKTYQTGLALKSFLDTILTTELDELLRFIPLGKDKVKEKIVKNDALSILKKMSEVLNARLAFYQLVLDNEKSDEVLKQLFTKLDRRKEWDKQIGQTFKNIDKASNGIISQELRQDNIDKKQIEQGIQQLIKKIKQIINDNNDWHEKNQTLGLENEITISPLHFELQAYIQQKEEKKAEFFEFSLHPSLQESIASTELVTYNERILISLNDTYQRSDLVFKEMLERFTVMLEVLNAYEMPMAEKAIELINDDMAKYDDMEEKSAIELLEENILTLNAYKNIVAKAKQSFERKIIEKEKAFTTPLLKQYDNQIRKVESVVNQFETRKSAIQKKLSLQSEQSRIQREKELGHIISVKYPHLAQAKYNESDKGFAHHKAMEAYKSEKSKVLNSYENTIAHCYELYQFEQKLPLDEQITNTVLALKSRHEFLSDADNNLAQLETQLHKVIEDSRKSEKSSWSNNLWSKVSGNSNTLYHLFTSIKKVNLQDWLEIDDDNWVSELYDEYTNANKWYGLNSEYFNQLVVNNVLPIDIDESVIIDDAVGMLRFVQTKRETINKELSIDDKGCEISPQHLEQFSLKSSYAIVDRWQKLEKIARLKTEFKDLDENDKIAARQKLPTLRDLQKREKNALSQKEKAQALRQFTEASHQLALLNYQFTRLEHDHINDKQWINDALERIQSIEEDLFLQLSTDEKLLRLNEIDNCVSQLKAFNFFDYFRNLHNDLGCKHELLVKKIQQLNEYDDSHNFKTKLMQFSQTLEMLDDTSKNLEKVYIDLEKKFSGFNKKFNQTHIEKLTLIQRDYLVLVKKLENLNLKGHELVDIETAFNKLAINRDYINTHSRSNETEIKQICVEINELSQQVKQGIVEKLSQYNKRDLTESSRGYPVEPSFKNIHTKTFFAIRERSYKPARIECIDNYVAPKGIFDQYLTQRHATFWFRDFMSIRAATFLGCFGYKTQSRLRQDYIDELTDLLEDYKTDSSKFSAILDKIQVGLADFKPRAIQGEVGYDRSLHSRLTMLWSELNGLLEPFPEEKHQEKLGG
jgi:hypothetical protein